jgi:hypothetical protein
MDGNFYDDPSLGGRGYPDERGQIYEYEDGTRNDMQPPYVPDEIVDESQQPQQRPEDVSSSTMQSTTVTGK